MGGPAPEVVLRHGRVANWGAARLAVWRVVAPSNAPRQPEVVLLVVTDRERKLTLRPGDAFQVGGETWKLKEVLDPEGHDYRVVLSRLSSTTRP